MATAVATPAWTRLAAEGPAPREDHTWTVDAERQVAYLFGGRDGPTVHGDLWAYDLAGDAWTQVTTSSQPAGQPPSQPSARFGHEAVWVDGIGLVIFAGQAGTTLFGDLWAYDPGTNAWSELPSAGATPVARYGTCAALGPDGRLWISHGFTSENARFADTRAYDFDAGSWTDLTPADGQRPVERCLHGCWFDDAGGLVLYAGQTTGVTALGDRWRLADGAWTRLEVALPPDRNLYARAPVAGGTLIFGGQGLDGLLSDLWLLPDGGGDAVPIDPGDGPVARAGAELVSDTGRQRVLLFGGRGADGQLSDIWSLTGVALGSR
ncbi:MAG: Kelch repeat-containing protein [Candidatus Limnocylindria bacterium]